MQMVRKSVVLGGLLLIGFLIGPLLLAVVSSLKPFTPSDTNLNVAYRLLDAYDYYHPEPVPMFSMNSDGTINDCGYDRNSVFAQADDLNDGSSWTPYNGYFDLTLWVSDEFYREIKRQRADQLSKDLSSYELRFLDHCIRETGFASICARNVRGILAASGLSSSFSLSSAKPRPDQRRRFNSICTYLDGLVARRGGQITSKGRSGRWPNY
jgi:hypothetical protein